MAWLVIIINFIFGYFCSAIEQLKHKVLTDSMHHASLLFLMLLLLFSLTVLLLLSLLPSCCWLLFSIYSTHKRVSLDVNCLSFSNRPEIVKSVELQRHRLDMARSARAKASESADLLLMAMYTRMPPARALEIRTLEILPKDLSTSSPVLAKKNLIQQDQMGGVTMTFQNYKTFKTYGCDTTKLQVSCSLWWLFVVGIFLLPFFQSTFIKTDSQCLCDWTFIYLFFLLCCCLS